MAQQDMAHRSCCNIEDMIPPSGFPKLRTTASPTARAVAARALARYLSATAAAHATDAAALPDPVSAPEPP